jgi:exopolysaccharide biosynthesis WecB/TagA/CpsF family protein
MKHRLPIIDILGIPIACSTAGEALAEIARIANEDAPALVTFVNAQSLRLASTDADLRKILQDSAIVLNDGVGVAVAARILGKRFPANLNGTDLTPAILRIAAANRWRVFLLGSREGIATKAAEELARTIPHLQICGTMHGHFSREQLGDVLAQIQRAQPEVLIVGMGNPIQEKWLAAHLAASGARLGVGVGAFLDFTAGIFPRAPTWVRGLRLEWLFRLSREPRRLWKRYFLGGPVFIARVGLDALRRRRR